MQCLICEEKEKLNFFDNYKLEVQGDEKYFNNLKIYNCKSCDFSFVHPMPDENKLNYFYINIIYYLIRIIMLDLFPQIEPYEYGLLDVDNIHKIYWEKHFDLDWSLSVEEILK